MGLAGLGLAARAAAPLFPGVFRAPAYFTEPWIALALVFFVVLLVLYARKLAIDPAGVREELANPATMGFCAALPVGMTLLAGGIAPYLPLAGKVLWWAGAALLLALQAYGVYRVLSGAVQLGQVNGGWLILFVGGIVVPGSGIGLGYGETARFMYGLSAVLAPAILSTLVVRAIVAPPLPEALRPTWFIILVPPSLIYAHGTTFYEGLAFLENLYFAGLMLAAGLLLFARRFLAWPFGPAWWAFTFPLDALAYAAVRYAQQHREAAWQVVAAAALVTATVFVVLVLIRTLASLKRKPA